MYDDEFWNWIRQDQKAGCTRQVHQITNHISTGSSFKIIALVEDKFEISYDFYIHMPYILSTLYYIYRLHTYPKDSAVANNDFSRRNENKKSCGTRPGQDAGGHQRHGEHSCLGESPTQNGRGKLPTTHGFLNVLNCWTRCLWYVVKHVIEAPPSEKRGQFNQSSAGL